MTQLLHSYSFDPTHGFSKEALLKIQVEMPPPPDFKEFWRGKFDEVSKIPLHLSKHKINGPGKDHQVSEVYFNSHANVRIGGWLFVPTNGIIERAFVMGHGYGTPVLQALLPLFRNSVVMRINSRGFGLSQFPGISNDPQKHVICGLNSRDEYVHLGCAADIWSAATVLLELFPAINENLFYWGESFGAGIGALALPWDKRFKKACLIVPSFGNHPMRVQHECTGSGKAIRDCYLKNSLVLNVLKYFDSAIAARFIECPVLGAAALFDPSVPPFGQFSVFNSMNCQKDLFVLTAGHHLYSGELEEREKLYEKAANWFFFL